MRDKEIKWISRIDKTDCLDKIVNIQPDSSSKGRVQLQVTRLRQLLPSSLKFIVSGVANFGSCAGQVPFRATANQTPQHCTTAPSEGPSFSNSLPPPPPFHFGQERQFPGPINYVNCSFVRSFVRSFIRSVFCSLQASTPS